jgi:hypothetical protein
MISNVLALSIIATTGIVAPKIADPAKVNVEKYRPAFNETFKKEFDKLGQLSGPFEVDAHARNLVLTGIKEYMVNPNSVELSDLTMGRRSSVTVVCGRLSAKSANGERINSVPFWGMFFPAGYFGPMGNGTRSEANFAEALLVCEDWGLKIPDIAIR